ncbi:MULTISPECIES: PTS sugar transporter subunit IIA [Lactobacillus]|uniref:PTS sugar transporter subunit IIA n=1 Tax=Lactobacillus TaxID=1578 RepID=UPI001C6A7932|nr:MULTISPECIES: PTS sugar transporter subunit IIA [Lactobacillus]MCX8721802.1 PTS sugar transporter subunit IIA [Lactobacillus sp. B4010]MCX8723587.1 PTS sugar transporter subunit IIA [Lactobacillus sp. B4005]MCX8731760.1 PTS sugar transporter subunit IIA [Lactobacillus sp. B4015]MCX8733966.1 PTS sugar transporter subunit IIA [Lactobacillus sp. B4012]QYN55879.1 PTS sugar transporter subunit IIA [Lactobacillus panisapium]
MKYLILVSHGKFAEGIKTSLEMFAGDSTKQCFALCLHNGESATDFETKVDRFLQEQQFKKNDEFVILADIIGGSPLTTFLDSFSKKGYLEKAVVLGGMNFSMALTAIVSLSIMSKEELAKAALSEGEKAIKQYKISQLTDDEDDI